MPVAVLIKAKHCIYNLLPLLEVACSIMGIQYSRLYYAGNLFQSKQQQAFQSTNTPHLYAYTMQQSIFSVFKSGPAHDKEAKDNGLALVSSL